MGKSKSISFSRFLELYDAVDDFQGKLGFFLDAAFELGDHEEALSMADDLTRESKKRFGEILNGARTEAGF